MSTPPRVRVNPEIKSTLNETLASLTTDPKDLAISTPVTVTHPAPPVIQEPVYMQGPADVPRRSRMMTERGLMYQLELKERQLKSAITKWRRQINATEHLLVVSEDIDKIRTARRDLSSCMEEIDIKYDELLHVAPYTATSIESIVAVNQDVTRRIAIRLIDATSEAGSRQSQQTRQSRQTNSSRSSRSLRLEASAKAAELKVQLKYHDAEAEMERLQLKKKLEIAEAQIQVFKEDETIEVGTIQPPQDEMQTSAKVRQYIDSLPEDGELSTDEQQTRIYAEETTKVTDVHDVQVKLAIPSVNVTQSVKAQPQMAKLQTDLDIGSITMVPKTQSMISPPGFLSSRQFMPRCSTQVTRPTVCVPITTMAGGTRVQTSPAPFTTAATRSPQASVPRQTTWGEGGINDEQPRSASVSNVMMNQIQLIDTISKQNKLSRLPAPEPGVFSGDSLMYPSWKRAFTALIDRCGIEPGDRIYYLQKYLSGEAKDSIEGYLMLSSDTAYEEAQSLLESRYGDSFIITNAYRDKLEKFSKIGPRDSQALRNYADFLSQCLATMKSIQGLDVLDDARQNQQMISRLPDWLRLRWGRKATDYRKKHGFFPKFEYFVDFITTEADIACDPITSLESLKAKDGKPTDVKGSRYKVKSKTTMATQSKEAKHNDQTSQNRAKSSSSDASNSQAKDGDSSKPRGNPSCYLCKDKHYLSKCEKFKAKSAQERLAYLQENKRCVKCFGKGHVPPDCRTSTYNCLFCHGEHHTLTHVDDNVSKPGSDSSGVGQGAATSVVPGRNPNAANFVPTTKSSQVHRVSTTE